jgi:Uma2 family endonuclease
MTDRIILKPITADDVERHELEEQVGREIINGEWAEENEMTGKLHGRIGLRLIMAITPFVTQHQLGEVYPDNVSYVLEGTKGNIITMRIPDLSFVAAHRVDDQDPSYYYLAPDVAVEILSSSETPRDTQDKITDYLRFGTRHVWVVDPAARQIIVYLPDGTTAVYGAGDTLSGGDVLPGFELHVARIFE